MIINLIFRLALGNAMIEQERDTILDVLFFKALARQLDASLQLGES